MASVACPQCGVLNSEFNLNCVSCDFALPLSTAGGTSDDFKGLALDLQLDTVMGRDLGHYRVECSLGAGGMGRVYLAEDQKLGRKVALKVLPPQATLMPSRLERFQREARVLASLNHPNIVTLHSVEEFDGIHFLTMELVQGKTLSELLPVKGLELNRILEWSLPLISALKAAHQRRILHRDLKPSNVMLSEDGRIKVLDFGLAKLWEDLESPPLPNETSRKVSESLGEAEARISLSMLTSSPSAKTKPLSADASTSGSRLFGTLPYMSPEQLRGQLLNERSDYFSLGVVLYELATGQRPFQGRTTAELMHAIRLETQTTILALRPELPAKLSTLIDRLLQKDAQDRFRTLEEVEELLHSLQAQQQTAPLVDTKSAHKLRTWLATALLTLLGLALGLNNWLAREAERLELKEVRPLAAWQGKDRKGRISPDGQTLAVLSERSGNPEIWLQPMDGSEPRSLTKGTSGKILDSVWSPEGTAIAFLVLEGRTAALKSVAVQTGQMTQLPAPSWLQPTHQLARWGQRGLYFFGYDGLWRMDVTTGDLEEFGRLQAGFEFRGVDIDREETSIVATLLHSGKLDLYVRQFQDETWTALTQDGHEKREPKWLGRGTQAVVFLDRRNTTDEISVVSLGDRRVQRVFGDLGNLWLDGVSEDGWNLACTRRSLASQIFRSDTPGSGDVQWTSGAFFAQSPSAQTDGPLLVFKRKDNSLPFQTLKAPGDSDGPLVLVSGSDSALEEKLLPEVGQSPLLSPNGRWLAFLQQTRQASEKNAGPANRLRLKDLSSQEPSQILSSSYFAYGHNEIPNYSLAANLAWTRDSSGFYFVASTAPKQQVLHRFRIEDQKLESLVQVPVGWQFYRFVPDPAGKGVVYGLAMLPTETQAHARFSLVHHDLQTGTQRTILDRDLAAGDPPPFLVGWTGNDSLILVHQEGPKPEPCPVRIEEIGLDGRPVSEISIANAHHPATASFNQDQEELYLSRQEGNIVNIFSFSFINKEWRQVTSNRFPGITYSGFNSGPQKSLFYARQQFEYDVVLFELYSSKEN